MNNLQTTIHDNRDEKLVSLIRQGNSVAFGHLVERHQPYIARVVSRFLFCEEDSRDMVQDTFVRIWKHLDDYDGHCRFTTWIYTIAFNLCLDKTRALKRRREDRFPSDYEIRSDDQGEAMDQISNPDQVGLGNAIRSLAQQLRKVQRLVFVLRDIQDLTVEEVCDITGFDAGKVKSNLYWSLAAFARPDSLPVNLISEEALTAYVKENCGYNKNDIKALKKLLIQAGLSD